MPTRCNRGFYLRSYCLLNMFRAPLCPSPGAQEYYTVVASCGISCCGFQVVGMVWSWGLCVRFAGCCSQTSSTSDCCRGPLPSPEEEVFQIHSHQIIVKFHNQVCCQVLICLPSLDRFYSAEAWLKTNQNNAMPEGRVVQLYHLLFNRFWLGYMFHSLNHKCYQVFKYVLNHSLSLAEWKNVTSSHCTECSGK